MSNPTKRCTRCKETKPISEFSVSTQGVNGPIYRTRCKRCCSDIAGAWGRDNRPRASARKRGRELEKLYGITQLDYDRMLRAQGGVCAICGKDEPNSHGRTGTKFRLSIDHCHDTNVVRGLLCQRCNRAIGLLDDSPVLLRKAISYLLKNGGA